MAFHKRFPATIVLALLALTSGYAESSVFQTTEDARAFFLWQDSERSTYGAADQIQHYNKTPLSGTVLMQRSGRKRLYDHNILLRAAYAGRIVVSGQSLGKLIESATFIDIGSGILYGDGAPTVRDIFEDNQIMPHIRKLTASDIEDTSSPQNRYISIYRKRPNLPFRVVEVPMLLGTEAQWEAFLNDCQDDHKSPIIVRSVNTGPDLFYTNPQVIEHLTNLLRRAAARPVVYFFSKFVLYKPADKDQFRILGEIDPNVGVYHKADVWLNVNWQTRTLQQAFKPGSGVRLQH